MNSMRFRQRVSNYKKSIKNLELAAEKESLNEMEKAGLIQFFEVSFELAWKCMKDFLTIEGYDVKSPRESIKTAFSYGLVEDGALWLEALEKRNLASHTYDEEILNELEELILHRYFPLMDLLLKNFEEKL